MSTPINKKAIQQLADVIKLRDQLLQKSRHADCSDLPDSDLTLLAARARAAIDRITGSSSTYARDATESMSRNTYFSAQTLALVGVVEALKADIQGGYLETLRELLHAELFSDFLDMADHLLAEGYKDAAAVIGGSSLESHLRQLCVKNGIPVITTTSSKGTRQKKADTLNSELAAASVFSKLDQKSVTSWLDLRNKAAHGHYTEYTKEQVALFLQALQDFMGRNPA